SVKIVPAKRWTGCIFPTYVVIFSQNDARPVGEVASAATFTFDIVVNAPSVGELLPDVKIVLIKLPGDCEPDAPAALGNGLRPGFYVGTIVDRKVVGIRTRRYGVKLDEVDSPRGEQI